ncbi:hypothetical protein [Variovorax ginsengisoli]|uniref:Uncharacterized protein n=1 Tax=Variovorax ginsengisoli TaxID=363844 RepID=A0ABT9S5T1_9BURK|nr:hypothetical protein [Variovorax ginsengisoli]MDP9899713.1 hypothetical protein [Variovorax ginsengisoli]
MDYSITPRILPGLPGVGPPPRQFSATGLGMHSEGLVVEFGSAESWCWIGNFQPGMTKFSAIYADTESLEANVFAGGRGYRVNVESGELIAEFGGDIESVVEILNGEALLLCSSIGFELHRRAGGVIWRSRRVSWDGFRNLSIHVNKLTGEAWMFDDSWHSFTVVLETGAVEGGSYYEVRQ